jgi:hypothetical protein
MPVTREFPLHVVTPFESANSEVVRSIQQRGLLNRWLKLYAERNQAPAFSEYDPNIEDIDRTKLVYYKVTPADDQPNILIESYGSHISEAYGSTGLGQELSAYLGPDRAALVVPIYLECITRHLPTYTISRVEDNHGRKVDLERLLLPFQEGQHITRIIASFETISIDGHFELRRLMADHIPVDVVRTRIDKDLFFTPPPRIPAHDRIEFE